MKVTISPELAAAIAQVNAAAALVQRGPLLTRQEASAEFLRACRALVARLECEDIVDRGGWFR